MAEKKEVKRKKGQNSEFKRNSYHRKKKKESTIDAIKED